MIGETPLSRRRWLILASSVISFFATGLTFFAVPPLASELVSRLGLSNLQVGILMGSIAIPAILLSVPMGLAVDRWSPRPAGNVGLALMAIGGGLFAIAPGFALLLAGRLLFGIGGLVLNLVLARVISAAFAGRELSLAMGIFSAVYPASMIVIFSAHTFLLESLGWRLELAALAAVVVAAAPLHNLAMPRSRSRPGDSPTAPIPGTAAVTPALVALAAGWMLFFTAFASVLTFAPQWAGGGRSALLVVTAVMWVALFLSPVAGSLIDRSGAAQRWAAGGQLTLAFALAAMAAGALSPLPAMLFVGLAAATVPTAVYSLPARLVQAEHVGFAFGFITAFSNLGTLVGPAAAGALLDHSGAWPPVWALLGGVALAGSACFLACTPGSMPKRERPEGELSP